jgi:hypothetical protein
MRGFSEEWADVPDFVLGITRRIWEDRRIGSLHAHYARDLVVRSPASVVVGTGGVIAATLATLAEFPDRELLGEDVIWCPDPEGTDAEGEAYLSSHRLVCTATHSGPGVYGAASGRRLTYRILADCAIKADQVRDEWLVRDQGAIVRQMGLDPMEWTRDLIAREGGPERCVRPFTAAGDRAGPYRGRGDAHPAGARLAGILERMAVPDLSAVASEYDPACEFHGPGGVSGHGHAAVEAFWLGLHAALPGAAFSADHVLGRADPRLPPRAAVRWSLAGRHEGWGAFGRPSGAPVHVLGITQVEFGPRGLRREWTLIDETAIWKQILLHTGAL